MGSAGFRFHGSLEDHLRPSRRGSAQAYPFDGRPAVKDAIEALGVPHPEVDVILVNGAAVDFAYRLRDGDRVEVHPMGDWPARAAGVHGTGAPQATVRVGSVPAPAVRVGPPPLAEPRFVLDTHLGRLAAYLRMLGFDTRYATDAADERLARCSADEQRVLLTRDRGLLKRGAVVYGYYVRAVWPRAQLREVVVRFGLPPLAAPFSRCIRCNGRLEAVEREQVRAELPPRTLRYYDTFRRCASCGAVYWAGSHQRRMRRLVAEVLGDTEAADRE